MARWARRAAGALLTLAALWGIFKGSPRAETFVFEADKGVLYNPLIGYAPQADEEDDVGENTLVYLDITWRELEPEEGVYDWEGIEEENHLSRWRKEGKHAVLRFVCDYPGDEAHMDIPDWLYEKTGGDGVDYDIKYGKGYAPNYNNETFIRHHARAVRALGEYFGRDTFVSYVELGSLGHWGEWHVKAGAGLYGMPEGRVRRAYVEPYTTSFPHARLLMRRPFREMPDGCGVYNDMTGEEKSTREWLGWIAHGGEYDQTGEADGLKAAPEIWKRAPVGGEFTSSADMEEMLGDQMETTLALLKASHMSFLGPNIPDMETGPIRAEALFVLSCLGYRYRIAKMEMETSFFQKNVKVTTTWVNDGAAPIYWSFTPCLYVTVRQRERGADAGEMIVGRYPLSLDLTALLPGQEREATAEIPREFLEDSGLWSVRIWAGIENPETGRPEVLLAMDAQRRDHLSLLWAGE